MTGMIGFLAIACDDGRRASREILLEFKRILDRRGPHGSEMWIGEDAACCFTRFISHDGERNQGIVRLGDGGRLVGHVRIDDRRIRGASPGAESDAALFSHVLEANGYADPGAPPGHYTIAT